MNNPPVDSCRFVTVKESIIDRLGAGAHTSVPWVKEPGTLCVLTVLTH